MTQYIFAIRHHRAAFRGSVLLLIIALSAAVSLGAQNPGDEFISAAKKGDLAAMKSLLAKGANVNAKTNYGATALSFACDRGNVEVVKFLLDNGADTNVKDTFYGATPLTWAEQHENAAIIKLLLEKGATGKEPMLVGAAAQGQIEIVKTVLEVGGLKPETLGLALKRAEAAKHTEVADLLKKAGAVLPPKSNVQIDADTLRSYAGVYKFSDGELTITYKDGNLTGGFAPQQVMTLEATDKTTFGLAERDGVTIVFNDQGGKITSLTWKAGGNNIEMKRVEK